MSGKKDGLETPRLVGERRPFMQTQNLKEKPKLAFGSSVKSRSSRDLPTPTNGVERGFQKMTLSQQKKQKPLVAPVSKKPPEPRVQEESTPLLNLEFAAKQPSDIFQQVDCQKMEMFAAQNYSSSFLPDEPL